MIDPKEYISAMTESAATRVFLGFAPPTSNTTYTPNQFFDVCVPNYSRGCVRLVAYMIRRTLGWCDAHGNPQEDQIIVSFNDLINDAGISRGAIGEAIEEAIAGKFIRCVRKGRAAASRQTSITALYELCWSPTPEYVKDPKRFQGFFEGEGNRTDIPNEYFDVVVRAESLAVIKVVGAIIRFSIGFQASRGARRQQVQLSFSDIQRYAKITVRRHVSSALQLALEKNYVVRVHEGLFSPDKDLQATASYALKWLDKGPYPHSGTKKTPETTFTGSGSKRTPETAGSGSKKTPENRSKKDTRGGSIKTPEERFKKDTTIQMKLKNETFNKQQQPAGGGPVAVETPSFSYQLLREAGFSERDAEVLASIHSLDAISNQIGWLDQRNPSRNRLGMLRKAIEEGWPQPETGSAWNADLEHGKTFAAYFYAGYAGNQELPVTTPTLGDAQDAQAFVEKLLGIWPDEQRISEWGRSIGKLFAHRAGSNKNAFVSCRLALRTCGDDFYARVRSERQTQKADAMKEAREEHKRKYGPVYKEYLIATENRIKESNTDEYKLFEKTRMEAREQIAKNPYYSFSEEFRAEQLARFDTPRQRLLDFAKHFDIGNFWKWDRDFNPERFQERSHALCE